MDYENTSEDSVFDWTNLVAPDAADPSLLLAAIDAELVDLRSIDTRNGLSQWALLTAGAGVGWLTVSRAFASAPDWTALPTVAVLLTLQVVVALVPFWYWVLAKEESSGQEPRFLTVRSRRGRTRLAQMWDLARAAVCVTLAIWFVVPTLGDSGWLFAAYFAWEALSVAFVTLVLETDVPLPAIPPRQRWWSFPLPLLATGAALGAGVLANQGLAGMGLAPRVADIQLALLFGASFFVVERIIHTLYRPAKIEDLLRLRREISLRRVAVEDAEYRLDAILYGSRAEDIFAEERGRLREMLEPGWRACQHAEQRIALLEQRHGASATDEGADIVAADVLTAAEKLLASIAPMLAAHELARRRIVNRLQAVRLIDAEITPVVNQIMQDLAGDASSVQQTMASLRVRCSALRQARG